MYSSDTGLFQSQYVMCGLTNGAQSPPALQRVWDPGCRLGGKDLPSPSHLYRSCAELVFPTDTKEFTANPTGRRELGVKLRPRLKSIRTSVHSTLRATGLRTGGDNEKVLHRREL